MMEKWSLLIFAVTDKENGGNLSGGYFQKEIEKMVSVSVVQPLCRFIQNEEYWAFDECPGNEHKPLFGKGQFPERNITFFR